MRRGCFVVFAAGVLFAGATARAQYYQTDFPADEFRSRHARLFDAIGTAAVAVIQGMPQTEGFTLPRQHNTFYYLSGIETPGAYLLLVGRSRKATVYLPARNPRLEAAEGRVLSAEDGELVKSISGVDDQRIVRRCRCCASRPVWSWSRPTPMPSTLATVDWRRGTSSSA
jgi:aminopeptidase P-like protein